MSFSLSQRAAFDQCDPAGVLFYGNYPKLAHRAIEEFITSLGIPWADWFQNPHYGVPIRHLEADYLHPLYAGTVYNWKVHVAQVGETSVKFNVSVFNESQELCTRLESVHVFVDLDLKKKIKVPEQIKNLLTQEIV